MTLRLYFPLARPRARFDLYAFVLLSLSACSWIVSPEQGPIKCKVETGSKDPCPKDTTCINEVCTISRLTTEENCTDRIDNDGDDRVDEHNEMVEEECDHKDNDCDGEIDEGFKDMPEICDKKDNDCNGEIDEDYDQDHDGVTSCGDLSFKPGRFDCEPLLASAHPDGGVETCDGLDNDCDGNTDNAPPGAASLCQPNQLCLEGRCVTKSCATGESCKANERCVEDVCKPMNCAIACKEGQYCDQSNPLNFVCKDIPKQRTTGESCSLDPDCAAGTVCIDSAALKLPAMPRRVCGKACCADSDCSPSDTCFVSGTGARSCLPKTLAYNAATPPVCTGNDNCPAMTTCAVGESIQAPGTRKFSTPVCLATPPPPALLAPRNNVPFGEQCNTWSNCLTRACLPLVFTRVCTAPCRTSTDCTKLHDYNADITGYCQYVDLKLDNEGTNVPAGSFAPICLAHYEFENVPTRAPVNNSCRTNADCPDSTCLGASTASPGQCATTCCKDAHCTTARPNTRCVPVARGTDRYEMRCMPF